MTLLVMAVGFNKEKTKKIISLVLEKIKTEVDLQTLEEYQSLFKKETSLFNRSKAAAYLLMLCDQGKTIRVKDYRRPARPDEDSRPNTQRYPLADKESVRLFFSVGRSRRVFPREILGLINTKTAIPREDIGAIRILDNYSFVQVRDSVAEKIIEALNGINFRGRALTVNYAKSRKDAENSASESGNEQYGENPEDEEAAAQADDYLPDDDSLTDDLSSDDLPSDDEASDDGSSENAGV
jgi:hypothetical protein